MHLCLCAVPQLCDVEDEMAATVYPLMDREEKCSPADVPPSRKGNELVPMFPAWSSQGHLQNYVSKETPSVAKENKAEKETKVSPIVLTKTVMQD